MQAGHPLAQHWCEKSIACPAGCALVLRREADLRRQVDAERLAKADAQRQLDTERLAKSEVQRLLDAERLAKAEVQRRLESETEHHTHLVGR